MEGVLAVQQEVKDDAQTESVDLLIIDLPLIHLGRYEARSSCVLFLIAEILQFVLEDSKSEIDDFYSFYQLFFFVEDDHDVLRLKIAMNNT